MTVLSVVVGESAIAVASESRSWRRAWTSDEPEWVCASATTEKTVVLWDSFVVACAGIESIPDRIRFPPRRMPNGTMGFLLPGDQGRHLEPEERRAGVSSVAHILRRVEAELPRDRPTFEQSISLLWRTFARLFRLMRESEMVWLYEGMQLVLLLAGWEEAGGRVVEISISPQEHDEPVVAIKDVASEAGRAWLVGLADFGMDWLKKTPYDTRTEASTVALAKNLIDLSVLHYAYLPNPPGGETRVAVVNARSARQA